ncbi:hypothetical protein HDV00_000681 [Rhizophlyctis rosea]|nr:hypothetical protein HDV00_000681 [Rhizophlyctis rosea]
MNCDTTACHVVLSYVVPTIGIFTSVSMALAPLAAVRRVRREGTLGTVNPFPFVLTACNATAWVIYALLVKDYFIFVTNILGTLLGTYNTFWTFHYASASTQSRMVTTWLFMTAVIYIGGMISFIVLPDHVANGVAIAKTLMGAISTFVLLGLYSSPLLTLYTVVKQRNSETISYPLAIASLVNGALWFVYGLAVGDYFVWVPNGIGAILAVVQIVLKVVFRPPEVSDVDSINTVVAEYVHNKRVSIDTLQGETMV